jgi:hypothetical protein
MENGIKRKSLGISIPEEVKRIYLFNNRKDFIDQIDNGKMKPLYGNVKSDEEYVPIYIAYIPESEG